MRILQDISNLKESTVYDSTEHIVNMSFIVILEDASNCLGILKQL